MPHLLQWTGLCQAGCGLDTKLIDWRFTILAFSQAVSTPLYLPAWCVSFTSTEIVSGCEALQASFNTGLQGVVGARYVWHHPSAASAGCLWTAHPALGVHVGNMFVRVWTRYQTH
jgi:hypothetical protein